MAYKIIMRQVEALDPVGGTYAVTIIISKTTKSGMGVNWPAVLPMEEAITFIRSRLEEEEDKAPEVEEAEEKPVTLADLGFKDVTWSD